jgi:hypothetical protein
MFNQFLVWIEYRIRLDFWCVRLSLKWLPTVFWQEENFRVRAEFLNNGYLFKTYIVSELYKILPQECKIFSKNDVTAVDIATITLKNNGVLYGKPPPPRPQMNILKRGLSTLPLPSTLLCRLCPALKHSLSMEILSHWVCRTTTTINIFINY